MTTYETAPLSLMRVLRFTTALSAMMEGAGETPAAEPQDTPTTTAAALAGPPADVTQRTAARALQLFEALTQEGRAVEIARIVVVRADGREMAPGEVEADDFPAAVFLEGYLSFMQASNEQTAGLLGLPSGTGSTGAPPAPNPTRTN